MNPTHLVYLPNTYLKTIAKVHDYGMYAVFAKKHFTYRSRITVLQDGQFAAPRNKYWALNFLQILMIFLQQKSSILWIFDQFSIKAPQIYHLVALWVGGLRRRVSPKLNVDENKFSMPQALQKCLMSRNFKNVWE